MVGYEGRYPQRGDAGFSHSAIGTAPISTPTAVIPAIEQQIGASLTLVSGRAPVWFASDESRALARFADLWTQWSSVRKVKEGEITANLFGFLMFRPAPGD
jgi:hypothetical protein